MALGGALPKPILCNNPYFLVSTNGYGLRQRQQYAEFLPKQTAIISTIHQNRHQDMSWENISWLACAVGPGCWVAGCWLELWEPKSDLFFRLIWMWRKKTNVLARVDMMSTFFSYDSKWIIDGRVSGLLLLNMECASWSAGPALPHSHSSLKGRYHKLYSLSGNIIVEYLGGGEVKWRNSEDQPVLTVAHLWCCPRPWIS